MSKRARASRAPGNTARARLLDRRSSVIPPEPSAPKAPEPITEASEATHAASEAIHASSEPAHAASEPAHAASEPANAASEPAHAASEPAHAASESANAASEPAHAASESAHAASEPAHAASEPANAASEPAKAAKASKSAAKAKTAKAKPAPEVDEDEFAIGQRSDEVDGSLNPVHYEDEFDDEGYVPPSPELLERRARLRRVVMGVVGVAALIVVGALAKGALSKPDPMGAAASTAGVEAPATPAVAEVVSAAPAAPAPAASAAPAAADTAAPEGSAVPEGSAAAEEAASAAPAESAAPAAEALGPEAFAALRRETETLFNRGQSKEGIASARRMIAADPSEAMGYLFLGSGLQNMGKWQDGIDVYSQCVRQATRGPVGDCKRFGGKK